MSKNKTVAKKHQKPIYIAIEIIVILAIIAGAAFFLLGDKDKAVPAGDKMTATDYVQIDIANYGSITAELYGNLAPITVENFLKLTDEGFYDGLTFHRIISGFMIQGGDPLGNGMGGSEQNIKGEFAANGIENNLSHTRGVLSMARSHMPDSASSQFFIMHADTNSLDGNYAAFGKVLSGIEVVDAICEKTPVTDGNGSVNPADQPVITSIKRIEKP